MRFIFPLLLAAVMSASCSSPRRIVLDNGQGGDTPNTGGTTQVIGGSTTNVAATLTGSPMQRLNGVDQHLNRQGFQRVGDAVRNANMRSGGVVAYAIEAEAGRCYTAVTLGTDGSDVNMIILDPLGRNVGHNVDPGPNPWVYFCPTSSGRHIARVQMVSGAGEYFWAQYAAAPGNEPQLATLLGGAVTEQQQAVTIDPATSQRLEALDRTLNGDRFARLGDPLGVRISEGEDTRRELNLSQGACYAFASLGGQGAEDTDIYLLNSEGEQLEADRDRGIDGLVRICPQNSGAYTLRAQMYRGQGALFIAGWEQSRSAEPTPNTQVIASSATAGGGVDEAYALLDSDMQARGYEGYGEVARGRLTESETRNFGVNLEGGKCYAIIAVGAGTVRNLDLIVTDSGGSTVDRDIAVDGRPIVRVCAEESGEYRMQVKMTEGEGDFIYHAYRWPRGTRGAFGLSGLIYVRLGEVTSLLSVEGYEPDPNFAPGKGTLRREGASANHNLQLPAGGCYAVVVVGGDGVNDLDVTLSKGSDTLAGDGSRNAFPAVRYCTTTAGRYKVSVRAATGSGPYFYQVFKRSGS